MKIRSVGTDISKPIVAFRNFENVGKNDDEDDSSNNVSLLNDLYHITHKGRVFKRCGKWP